MDFTLPLCMQDSFARARTRPSARATIGYLVYNLPLRPHPKEKYIKSAQFLSLFCFSYNDISLIFVQRLHPCTNIITIQYV